MHTQTGGQTLQQTARMLMHRHMANNSKACTLTYKRIIHNGNCTKEAAPSFLRALQQVEHVWVLGTVDIKPQNNRQRNH